MEITKAEQEMLAGKYGPSKRKAMEILLQLGELYGAAKMVPVESVHMPGSSIVVTGTAGLEFVEQVAQEGVTFQTVTTLNPAAVDLACWRELGFGSDDSANQLRLTSSYVQMGAIPLHTCAPYQSGFFPLTGRHLSWGESSAVVLANSIFGAHTNREGGPSALASALTGRTPLYGYHLPEKRRAEVLVEVAEEPVTASDYGAMGYYVGRICRERVPVFSGCKKSTSLVQFKALGAALASSGSAAMFHVAGFTPFAPTAKAALAGNAPEMRLVYGLAERKEALARLNTAAGENVDMVAIGCPHASLPEIGAIARFFQSRGKCCRSDLWIMTSTAEKKISDHLGYTEIIEKAGGRIVTDTCLVLGSLKPVILKRRYRNIATNSAKLAHYTPGQWSLGCYFGSTEQCLQSAVAGVWKG